MSPPAWTPPAACPHAADPAPRRNRCSINNACFSTTHLPGAQSGNGRRDEGDAANERACSGEGWGGAKNGRGPRSLSDYWGMDTPEWSSRNSELGDEVSFLSHLLWRNNTFPKFLCSLQPTRAICWNRAEKGSSQGYRAVAAPSRLLFWLKNMYQP